MDHENRYLYETNLEDAGIETITNIKDVSNARATIDFGKIPIVSFNIMTSSYTEIVSIKRIVDMIFKGLRLH